jgi:hypothetical protein
VIPDEYALAFVATVAGCCDAGGDIVCIVDPNAPDHEIRVRAEGGDLADNFIVRTYGASATAGRYTSSCTPAMF